MRALLLDGSLAEEGTVVIDGYDHKGIIEEIDEADSSAWVRFSGGDADWIALEELVLAPDQNWLP